MKIFNKLINHAEQGFRGKRLRLTNLLDFFHYIFKEYDEDRAEDLAYLDFQNAFEKIPYQRLPNKLHSYGITDNIPN